jgi:hypothetical protein
MRLFLKNLFLFSVFLFVVFIAVCIPPLPILYKSKELLPIDKIITIQQNSDIVVGTAIRNIDAVLKYKTTIKLQPQILALGTSRIMQFRREYFTEEFEFYNAGGAVTYLSDYIVFINALNYSPQYIIINLDQFFFNKKHGYHTNPDQNGPQYDDNYNFLKMIINTYRMLVHHENYKYEYPRNIGLTATVHGDGFRKDGSYFYNRIINFPNSEYSKEYLYPFDNTMARINAGNSRFEYGDTLCDKSVDHVVQLLTVCKARNINVIAFIPPFAPMVNKKIVETDKYGYMKEIYPSLSPFFEQFGYEIYDFTDCSDISNNSMYIDGFHGNDITYKNILQIIKNKGSILEEYIT